MLWILVWLRRFVRAAFAVRRVFLLAVMSLVFVPILLLTILFGGSRRAARVLRYYFQRCGGAFVKLGQLLSTRYDLIPSVYCSELARLLDDAGPIDVSRILAVIEDDLGASASTLYSYFDPHPLAAAAIAQGSRQVPMWW
jgi:predicted unusual protein kinase regulating ubiquinone biosynthesis (AarF/ABC1/UbiB family)